MVDHEAIQSIFIYLLKKTQLNLYEVYFSLIVNNLNPKIAIGHDKNGKIFYEAGYEIDEDFISFINDKKLKKLHLLKIDNIEISASIRNTLQLDKARSREEALFDTFKILRPGEPPTIETAELLFNNLFFNADRYDLSAVGRLKIVSKFKKDTPIEKRILDKRNSRS